MSEHEEKKDKSFVEGKHFADNICAQIEAFLSTCIDSRGHRGATMSLILHEVIKRMFIECGSLDASVDILEDLANSALNEVFSVGVEFNKREGARQH